MQNSNFGSIIKKSLKLISITELLLRHLRHAKLAKTRFGVKHTKTYFEFPMNGTKNMKEYEMGDI